MASLRQALADENANINRGKPSVPKSGGLKGQQPDLANRKALSNITNKIKPLPRTVPRNPPNGESGPSKAQACMKKVARAKNTSLGPKPSSQVTKEIKEKAETWALEGIEKVYFSGKDMEELQEKMALEEVDRELEEALSYRIEIPVWFTGALVEDPPEIKDHLELDPLEDLYTKGGYCFNGMKQKATLYVDNSESYLGWLDLFQSKDWPTVIEEYAL